jgi:hypothetical protein
LGAVLSVTFLSPNKVSWQGRELAHVTNYSQPKQNSIDMCKYSYLAKLENRQYMKFAWNPQASHTSDMVLAVSWCFWRPWQINPEHLMTFTAHSYLDQCNALAPLLKTSHELNHLSLLAKSGSNKSWHPAHHAAILFRKGVFCGRQWVWFPDSIKKLFSLGTSTRFLFNLISILCWYIFIYMSASGTFFHKVMKTCKDASPLLVVWIGYWATPKFPASHPPTQL